jgi:hypothetical protein
VTVLDVGLAVVLGTEVDVVLDTCLVVEDARVDDVTLVLDAELIVEVAVEPPDGHV